MGQRLRMPDLVHAAHEARLCGVRPTAALGVASQVERIGDQERDHCDKERDDDGFDHGARLRGGEVSIRAPKARYSTTGYGIAVTRTPSVGRRGRGGPSKQGRRTPHHLVRRRDEHRSRGCRAARHPGRGHCELADLRPGWRRHPGARIRRSPGRHRLPRRQARRHDHPRNSRPGQAGDRSGDRGSRTGSATPRRSRRTSTSISLSTTKCGRPLDTHTPSFRRRSMSSSPSRVASPRRSFPRAIRR